MKPLLEVLNLTASYFQEKGIQNSRREAQDLICDILKLKRMEIYLEHERPLTEIELQMIRDRLLRRGKREPLAYIHGSVIFLDCLLKVNPAVLIPRQETEILTHQIIQFLETQDLTQKCLWDVCCGSGCIGIAIKKRFPQLRVISSDLSELALAVAQENGLENKVDIQWRQGDLLTPFKGEKANYIVCNPPYVSSLEYDNLEPEVRLYEPKGALIGGNSGLEFYERMALDLKNHLHSNGKVWFEIGTGQGNSLKVLFQNKPWKTSQVELDWSSQERFFFLEIE